MLAVSLPVAAPTAKTSDRGRSDIRRGFVDVQDGAELIG